MRMNVEQCEYDYLMKRGLIMKLKHFMHLLKWVSLLMILTTYFTFVTHAEPLISLSKQKSLDEYIQSNLDKLSVPHASVAISHKGELVYSQVFGQSISKDSSFYIGSISKSLTALAIAQLEYQGKISLDQRVSTYIDEFSISDEITVRHLVHHVSGMTEKEYSSWGALPADADFSRLVQDMNTMTLTHTPGEQFAYFNPNYSLLGYIIENVTGLSYVDYIDEYIIKPLKLKNTSAIKEVDVQGNLSFFGFSFKRDEQPFSYDLPAGYITSTAEDLLLFMDAIRYDPQSVGLSDDGFRTLTQTYPTDNFYSMGWMNYDLADRPAIHHGGSLPGYSSNAIMLVEDDYNIALLLNKNHLLTSSILYPDLSEGIIRILHDEIAPASSSYFWIYRMLLILFAFTILSNGKKIITMIKNNEIKTRKSRIKSIFINLAIPISIVMLLPMLAGLIFAQRGMSWTLVYLLMPDLIIWLIVGLSIHLIEVAIHTIRLVKENKSIDIG